MISQLPGPALKWAELLMVTRQPCLLNTRQFSTHRMMIYLPYKYPDPPGKIQQQFGFDTLMLESDVNLWPPLPCSCQTCLHRWSACVWPLVHTHVLFPCLNSCTCLFLSQPSDPANPCPGPKWQTPVLCPELCLHPGSCLHPIPYPCQKPTILYPASGLDPMPKSTPMPQYSVPCSHQYVTKTAKGGVQSLECMATSRFHGANHGNISLSIADTYTLLTSMPGTLKECSAPGLIARCYCDYLYPVCSYKTIQLLCFSMCGPIGLLMFYYSKLGFASCFVYCLFLVDSLLGVCFVLSFPHAYGADPTPASLSAFSLNDS